MSFPKPFPDAWHQNTAMRAESQLEYIYFLKKLCPGIFCSGAELAKMAEKHHLIPEDRYALPLAHPLKAVYYFIL